MRPLIKPQCTRESIELSLCPYVFTAHFSPASTMVLIEEIRPVANEERMRSLVSGSVDMDKLHLHVQEHELSCEEAKSLTEKLEEWLDIDNSSGPPRNLLLNLATLLFSKTSIENQLQLLRLISVYMNPHVSWSSAELAEAATLSVDDMAPHMPQFFEILTPHLLNVKNPKLTMAGYKNNSSKALGLQPTLGLRYSSASEEGKRVAWKKSDARKSLSWVIAVIKVGKRWPGFDSSWPLITTFMINVLDDSDTEFRALGCQLVSLFLECDLGDILLKSGLVHVFREAVETSLSFLPNLTPAAKSVRLLSFAYPTLYLLSVLNKAKSIDFVEILDKNILGLIAHIHGRGNDGDTNKVLSLLLEQVALIIPQYINLSVLVCFSRLIFTLNQLIINPFLVDADSGLEVVNAALKCHREILGLFSLSANPETSELVLLYKYDFIASWAILGKRTVKFGVGDTHTVTLLKQNVELLRKIASTTDFERELEGDLHETCAKVSEFQEYVY